MTSLVFMWFNFIIIVNALIGVLPVYRHRHHPRLERVSFRPSSRRNQTSSTVTGYVSLKNFNEPWNSHDLVFGLPPTDEFYHTWAHVYIGHTKFRAKPLWA